MRNESHVIATPARLPGVGLLLLLAVTPLSLAAAGDGVLPSDIAVARAIQRPDAPGLDALARGLDLAGEAFPATFVLATATALVLVRGGRRVEAWLIVGAAAIRVLNPLMKALFESPRPTPDLVRVGEHASGYGFPSGHTVVVPTVVERRWLRRSLQALVVVVIPLMGLARVRTGAHWPSDVLGGYLWGGILLMLLLAAYLGVRGRGRESVA